MTSNQSLPGWYPDPGNPSASLRWWDGQQWTDQTQPLTSVPGGPGQVPYPPPPVAGGGYPAGGYGTPGYNSGYNSGYNRGVRGPFGMRMRGRNSFSITALVVSAIYIGLAVTTHFVLLGIVPLFSAVRALRRREPLAPVALVAAILVIVVAVLTIR